MLLLLTFLNNGSNYMAINFVGIFVLTDISIIICLVTKVAMVINILNLVTKVAMVINILNFYNRFLSLKISYPYMCSET